VKRKEKKMTDKQRVRSPRYPSISLREAESFAKKIFLKDGMNAVDRESAVQHMGYSSLNGASATVLASLKQYGLVTDSGKGMLRLSEAALDLLEPESEMGRLNALRTAAFSPDLFASLRERFPDTVPSDSNLRAHLLRQGFTSAAVKSVVPSYLETCEYLTTSNVIEGNDSNGKTDLDSPLADNQEDRATVEAPLTAVSQRLTQIPISSGGRRMIFDTEEGEVVFTYPDNLSEDSVQDIEEWFALVAKRLRRATKH